MTTPEFDATPDQLADLLRWYGEMGVDAVMDDAPHDRFAAPPPPVAPVAADRPPEPEPQERRLPPRGQPPVAAPRPLDAATLSTEAAVLSAREAAAGAATLDELKVVMERFDGCGLKKTASRLVFADGNPAARVMFVGEAPGADEDRSGVPFVGKAGQLLDRMLAAVGLDRTSVYIANVVPWRPPANRTPTPQEVATCLPFISRQIALANPDVLVLLGGSALQALLPSKESITRARGKWLDYDLGPRTIRAMPMFHPAYLLRTPFNKKWVWRDLRVLAAAINLKPPV
jgi:DNA polymerase